VTTAANAPRRLRPQPDLTVQIGRIASASAQASRQSCITSILHHVNLFARFARTALALRGASFAPALGLLIELIAYLRIPDFSDQQIYPTLYRLNSCHATNSDLGDS
jgi:hypothetical protein